LAKSNRTWLATTLAGLACPPDWSTLARIHWFPWSTVWRVEAACGPVYFKLCAPSQAFEAPLTAALARWQPDAVLAPLAVDTSHARLLLPESGPTLRQMLDSIPDEALSGAIDLHWPPALRHTAQLQVALTAHVAELLAMGVPDQRLERLPSLLAALIAAPEQLVLDEPGGLSPEELAGMAGLLPFLTAACDELAAVGLPDTLDHGDIFDKHVLPSAGYRLLDWGDAVVTHPLLTLTAVSASVGARLPVTSLADRAVRPLLEAYLRPWAAVMPTERVAAAVPLAERLGALPRALNWVRAFSPHLAVLSAEHRSLYASGVTYWLRQLAETL
jgi:hypothetical protein